MDLAGILEPQNSPNDLVGFANVNNVQQYQQHRSKEKLEEEAKDAIIGDAPAALQQPWRVFINHIDSYHAGKLADLLLEHEYDALVFGARDEFSARDKVAVEEERDEEEEEDEEIRRKPDGGQFEPPRKFELTATAFDPKYACEGVKLISSLKENKEKFMNEILSCGFIIYDITQDKSQIDEVNVVVDELVRILESRPQQCSPCHRASESSTRPYHLILISSLSTWARTTATDQPLTDADYRRRKPHPSARELLECERRVATAGARGNAKHLLKTRVVCAGVTYGEGEADLHYAFKLAWLNEPCLPVFGPGRGDNLVPLIHVRDLAWSVYAVMRNWPKSRYIVASEPQPMTQESIIKCISANLGSGKVKLVSTSEAAKAHPADVTQRVLDLMSINLNVRPSYLCEPSVGMKWKFGTTSSFGENVAAVVHEYREARKLWPVRVVVLGPPASGKSMLARALARHYQLHYVALKRLIAETIRQLSDEANDLSVMENDPHGENEELDDDANEEEDAQKEENPRNLLNEIQRGLDENNGLLSDDLLTKIVRRKLLSSECQNQGYVMDGYPKTLNQARLLFQPRGEEEEDNPVLPEVVIVIDASDDFLTERVISLPERDLHNTGYTEECMLHRLRIYRERNAEEITPLQVFDELEIHPVVINIEHDDTPQMLVTFQSCRDIIGMPRNYGLDLDEVLEEKRRAKELAAIEAARLECELAERSRERDERARKWVDLMERLKEEEEERLCLAAEPLRHYLVKHVFPIITQGLTEVAKLRPDEPIDYLAEYLFKKNPEAWAFEPDHTETLSSTIDSVQQLRAEGLLRADYGLYDLVSLAFTNECSGSGNESSTVEKTSYADSLAPESGSCECESCDCDSSGMETPHVIKENTVEVAPMEMIPTEKDMSLTLEV